MIEDFLERLKTAIIYRFGPHFKDINLNLATFLDPRFKDQYTNEEYDLESISNILTKDYVTIKKVIPDLFESFEKLEESLNTKRIRVEEDDDYDDLWQEFENSNMIGENKEKESFNAEMKLYLIENKIPKKINPSIYWSKNSKTYPRLSVLARKYLTPLPTSAYSERCFSLSGEIISKKRSRLCPEMAEILVFLNKNFDLCMNVK